MKAKCEKCQHCKLIQQNDSIKCDYLNGWYKNRPKYCPNFTKKNSNAPTVSLVEYQKIVLEEREEARKDLWVRIETAIEDFVKIEKNIKTDLQTIINHIYVNERDSDREV